MGESSKVFIIISVSRQLEIGKIYITAVPEHGKAHGENVVQKALTPIPSSDDIKVMEGMATAMKQQFPFLQELSRKPPSWEMVGWLLSEEEYDKLGRPTLDSRVKITLKLEETEVDVPKIPKGDDFKCNGCGEIISETDFCDQEMKQLYLALKEKRLCETCLRKEGNK